MTMTMTVTLPGTTSEQHPAERTQQHGLTAGRVLAVQKAPRSKAKWKMRPAAQLRLVLCAQLPSCLDPCSVNWGP